MGTDNTAALTRASRKLRELASDTISIPTTEELAERKGAEIVEARRKLDAIIARQLKAEDWRGGAMHGNPDSKIGAEKAEQLNVIARLESESAILEGQVQSSRPLRLSPEQQWRRDIFYGPAPDAPPKDERRGAALLAARSEHAELVKQARLNGETREMTAKLREARLKIRVLEGAPFELGTFWPFSIEEIREGQKRWGA